MNEIHPLDKKGLRPLLVAAGYSYQQIAHWKVRGVPAKHCAAIESATGSQVTRKDLRPNDWQQIWPELVTAAPELTGAAVVVVNHA
jgi:DNA-binding transcriptional regulator YdaS (Cro superfamily)